MHFLLLTNVLIGSGYHLAGHSKLGRCAYHLGFSMVSVRFLFNVYMTVPSSSYITRVRETSYAPRRLPHSPLEKAQNRFQAFRPHDWPHHQTLVDSFFLFKLSFLFAWTRFFSHCPDWARHLGLSHYRLDCLSRRRKQIPNFPIKAI